jgi:uncharacterized membrane protein YeaQ/YmgE (transglycosylase-associated protein family)
MDTSTIILAAGSTPALGFVGWVIIGGLAGWIGSKIMGRDSGGFLGGWLLTLFGVDVAGGGWIFSFLTCLLGAVIFLWIVGKLTGSRK